MLATFVNAICFVRVPGNSAAVTALQEELNNRGIENVCLEDEVREYLCINYRQSSHQVWYFIRTVKETEFSG